MNLLDFDTSSTQIQKHILQIYQLKDRISFSREIVYICLCEHIMKFWRNNRIYLVQNRNTDLK